MTRPRPPTPDDRADARPHKGRITDARGRKVTQLDPVALHVLRRHVPIEREALIRIVGERGIGLSRLERGTMAAALIVLVGVAATLVGKHLAGASWGSLLRRSVPMLYLLILPFIMWGGARKKRIGRTATVMLKHGRCPHCGYDLTGLPADATDGATICPECGCAWRKPEASPAR